MTYVEIGLGNIIFKVCTNELERFIGFKMNFYMKYQAIIKEVIDLCIDIKKIIMEYYYKSGKVSKKNIKKSFRLAK